MSPAPAPVDKLAAPDNWTAPVKTMSSFVAAVEISLASEIAAEPIRTSPATAVVMPPKRLVDSTVAFTCRALASGVPAFTLNCWPKTAALSATLITPVTSEIVNVLAARPVPETV